MQRLAREARVDPLVRAFAVDLAAGCPPRGDACKIARVFDFTRERVRFCADPLGVELLHAPGFLLAQIELTGETFVDCDDAAVLQAALLGAVGTRSRFVVGSFLPSRAFHHVWAEGWDGAQWVQMDPFREERFDQPPTRLASREVG